MHPRFAENRLEQWLDMATHQQTQAQLLRLGTFFTLQQPKRLPLEGTTVSQSLRTIGAHVRKIVPLSSEETPSNQLLCLEALRISADVSHAALHDENLKFIFPRGFKIHEQEQLRQCIRNILELDADGIVTDAGVITTREIPLSVEEDHVLGFQLLAHNEGYEASKTLAELVTTLRNDLGRLTGNQNNWSGDRYLHAIGIAQRNIRHVLRMQRPESFIDILDCSDIDDQEAAVRSWLSPRHRLQLANHVARGNCASELFRNGKADVILREADPKMSAELRHNILSQALKGRLRSELDDCITPIPLLRRMLVLYRTYPCVADIIKELIEEFGTQCFPILFSYLSSYENLPWLAAYRNQWEQKYGESIRLDTVQSSEDTSNHPGDCNLADEFHSMCLFGEREDKRLFVDPILNAPGSCVLLRTGGKVIAALKGVDDLYDPVSGDASVIGMRNVCDAEGRWPVTIGGLYATDSHLVQCAKWVKEKHVGRGFPVLDLEHEQSRGYDPRRLRLRPDRLLWNKQPLYSERKFAAKISRLQKLRQQYETE